MTILQHSLERNHPLNSARIARLGLKNLKVVTVFDVHFDARFVIRLRDPNSQTGLDRNGSKSLSFGRVGESRETQKLVSEYCDEGESEFGLFANLPKEKNNSSLIHSNEQCNVGDDIVMQCSTGGPVITAAIGKNGVISSLSHTWMPQTHCKNSQFDMILGITEARDALAEGFVVQKLQKQSSKGSMELDEHVEFEVEVPPGSVLLFPSQEAVSVGDLEAMDVKVKNLIVLDGTWAKAKRMYVENPWLKLLPHLRLDLDKLSLYNEVRLQPKPGFLSTIESIVYALKAVGDSPEGLDNLLDVFESMVGDQRRCKEERLSNV